MTSTLPNDNIRNFDDQITNKLISEIIRDRIKNCLLYTSDAADEV